MAKYLDYFEQRSAEWFRVRLGIPTASEMHRIVTPCGKASKQSVPYMYRLLAEWMLGEPITDEFESQWMQHGREYEHKAVEAFEFQTDLATKEVGFVTTDDGLVGCSPDRLVGDVGVLEIKCCAPNTHVGYLLGESPDADHRVQVQAQLWITEREKAWICAYHPKLTPVIREIPRDEEFIRALSSATGAFVEVMVRTREQLERMYGPFVRPEPAKAMGAAASVFDGMGLADEDVEFIFERS